jgi:hypothetical protein
MPQTPDLFTRTMVDLYNENNKIKAKTGFQVFFGRGPGAQTIISKDSNSLDIDIVRGTEELAPLIKRGSNSRSLGSVQKNLQDGEFTSFTRLYPLAEQISNITGDEILFRQPGENPYQKKSRLERMRIRAANLNSAAMKRIIRTDEKLAAQSMLTGFQDAILGTAKSSEQYDFRRSAGNTIGVAVPWDNAAADIFGNIDAGCDRVLEQGQETPDILCVGAEAWSAAINNETFQSLANNRRIELIQVSRDFPVPPELAFMKESGWHAFGRLRTPGSHILWVFIYKGYYKDSAGNVVYYMPTDNAMITSSEARFDRYYGPQDRIPMGSQERAWYIEMFGIDPMAPNVAEAVTSSGVIVPESFFTYAYPSDDRKKISLVTQHSPIYATTQTDAVATLTDLIT